MILKSRFSVFYAVADIHGIILYICSLG